ncbi:MAG: M24 family metallopeptidase [Candidatus Bathyarchaeia archaeon]
MIYLFEKRLGRLRKLADEQDIEGFFVTSEPNMRYFTGFSALAIERLAGIVIPVNAKEPVLIVPKLEEEKAMKLSFFKDIRSYTDAENPAKLLGKVVSELNLTKGTVGVESFLPFKFYKMLKGAAPSLEVKEASDIFQKLRSVKSTEEINIMKKAAKIVIKGIKAGIEMVRAGTSELSVAFEIERTIKESGGEFVPFCIVLSGENSALPHGSTSKRKIRRGDAVLMDIGATFKGYYADVTRTVFVEEASQKQRRVYDIVLGAQESAVKFVKPQVKAREVDETARKIITEAGYGEFFTHRTGHGLGLEVHEEPYISQINEITLEPGMTFTVEPGIYLPNKFGVRIEDDVAVTEKGRTVLSKLSKDLLIV